MNSNPQVDPETKERWAGIRSAESMISELQDDINTLRSRVSGIREYQNFLETRVNNNDGFDTYESKLKSRADGRPNVDESDVETARDVVEPEFADFDAFAGDPGKNTGVFGLNDYDGYRSYLTNNGVSGSNGDADDHNKTIKALFTSGDVFIEKSKDFNDFDSLETWLENNGWTAEEAKEFVDKLRDKYSSYSDYLNALNNKVDTIEDLLNQFDHAEGDPSGGPRVERRGDELHLFGNNIRMFQLGSDAVTSPGGEVNWTMQTASQDVAINQPVPVEATGSTSASIDETLVTLVINGTVVDRKTVSVSGSSTSVQFNPTFESPGEREVRIGDSGTITLTAKFI